MVKKIEKTTDSTKKDKNTPTQPDAVQEQIAGLTALVKRLQSDLSGNSVKKSRYTEHTKEHTALMREYRSEDEKKIGIVTKLHDIRQKRDPDSVKRFVSLCKLDVLNPETEKEFTVEVNYLEFLQEALTIPVRIVKVKEKRRIEERVGTQYINSKNLNGITNETIGDNNYIFEVEFIDHVYTLEVLQGEFKGAVLENDGKGLNM